MNSLMKHRLAAGSALLLLAVGACGGADDASSKAQPSAEAGTSGQEGAPARAGAAEADEADQDAMREAEEAAEEAVDDTAGLMDAVYVADAGAVIRVEPATYGETGDALLKLAALQTEAPAAPEGEPAPSGDAPAALAGDPVRGKRIFSQCMACHTVQAGQNRVGPSLHGIIGKAAGSVPRFNYSPANKNSDVVWTEETMFEYLKNPREFMPGTRMIYAGMPKEQDRADVIAYIKSASE